MSDTKEGVYFESQYDGCVTTGYGTQFYTMDGHPITGVISYSIPETAVDNVRRIILTVELNGKPNA